MIPALLLQVENPVEDCRGHLQAGLLPGPLIEGKVVDLVIRAKALQVLLEGM